jgi:hypothetical protein
MLSARTGLIGRDCKGRFRPADDPSNSHEAHVSLVAQTYTW